MTATVVDLHGEPRKLSGDEAAAYGEPARTSQLLCEQLDKHLNRIEGDMRQGRVVSGLALIRDAHWLLRRLRERLPG